MTLRGWWLLTLRPRCRLFGHQWEDRTNGKICFRCYGWEGKP